MRMTVTEQADRRAAWKLWLRISISLVILAVLISRIDFGSALPDGAGTLVWLVVGVLVAIGSLALAAWRWQRVLVGFDRPVGFVTLASHYFAGQFVGNVLPSTIGGDILRVSRVTTSTGSGSVAFASVVLERLTGWLALPVITVVGFALRPSLLDVRPSARLAMLVAGIAVVVLAVILYLSGHPRIAGRFASHENWMRFVGAVHLGVDRLRRDPRRAAIVVTSSLLYQASAMLVLYVVVRMLQLPVPFAAVLAFGPAVAMLQVLPVSFSGLGVREGALVLMLEPLGVTTGQAVALGLIWYGMILLASLLGAPSFAIGHRSKISPSRT